MTGAIILAGGRSSRLGQPKELLKSAGSTLLDATLAACDGCDPIVLVGPRREGVAPAVIQTREDPAYGGPVAGIRAGLAQVGSASSVLVLSCDMPKVAAVVAQLREHSDRLDGLDALMLRDNDQIQPLAALWNVDSLAASIAREPSIDRSVMSLGRGLEIDYLDVAPGLTQDIDDPADLSALWPTGVVSSVMVTRPAVIAADADLTSLEHSLASSHTHMAIVTDGPRVVSTVLAEDLSLAKSATAARQIGTLAGRSTTADADIHAVATEMINRGERRRVVIDDDNNLLGLLCLNRRGDGFCTDADVQAHLSDRSSSG